ncbi:MAG: hypothetical protein GY765_41935, partial [bacterium]|nr:hypothetical protein [bacterium]
MKKRSWKKRILIICATLFLLVICLFGLLHTQWARSMVKNQLVESLGNQGLLLQLDKLDYNLLKAEIRLENISVSVKSPIMPHFLKASAITLKLPYSVIWKDIPEITLLEITGPSINVIKASDGSSNLPVFPPSATTSKEVESKEALTIPLILHRLNIVGLEANYLDVASGFAMEIPDVSINGGYLPEGVHSLALALNKTGKLTYDSHTFPLETLKLEAGADLQQVRIASLEFKSGENHLTLTGSLLDLTKVPAFENIEFKAKLDSRQFNDLPLLKDGTDFPHRFAGTISLEGLLNGPLADPKARFRMRSTDLRDEASKKILLDFDGSYGNKTFSFSGFEASWENNGRIKGDGRIYLEKNGKASTLSMEMEGVNLGLFKAFTKAPIYSLASGHMHFSWTDLSPEAMKGDFGLKIVPLKSNGPLAKKPASGQERLFLAGDMDVGLDKGRVFLDVRYLHFHGVNVGGEFQAGPKMHSPLSGSIHLDIEDFRSVLPLVKTYKEDLYQDPTAGTPGSSPPAAPGSLHLKTSVAGSMQNPSLKARVKGSGPDNLGFDFDLNADIRNIDKSPSLKSKLQMHALKYGNMAVKGITFQAGTAGKQLNFTLLPPLKSTTVKGRLDLEPPHGFHAELKMTNLPTAELLKPLGISGNLPKGSITALIKCNQRGIDIRKLLISGDKLNLQAKGKLPFASTAPKGKIAGTGPTPSNKGLSINGNVDTAILGTFFNDITATGKASVQAHITGSLTAPLVQARMKLKKGAFSSMSLGAFDKINLDMSASNEVLRIDTFGFTFPGCPLFSLTKPCNIMFKAGTVTIDDFSLEAGENRIRILGTVTPGSDGPGLADITAKGHFNSGILENFTGFEIYGKNDLDIHISGPLDNPSLEGTVDTRDTGFNMKAPDVFVNGVNGRLKLIGGLIDIETMKGRLNDGNLTIGGAFDLTGQTPGVITCKLDKARFHYPTGLKTEISADLRFKQEKEKDSYRLTGDIDMVRGVYKNILSGEDEGSVHLEAKVPEMDLLTEKGLLPEAGFRDKLNLDIRVATSSPLWVEDDEVSRSEITALLRVKGTAARPALEGQCNIKKGGEVYFYGRTFTVERGVVDFHDPSAMIAELDVAAVTRISDYDITLTLLGTTDTPIPILSSKPPLPRSYIISLLLTGRLNTDVSASEFDLEKSSLNAAAKLAAGFAGRKISKMSGLDSVRIDTGLEDKNPRVTIGQHLTPKLELVFSQDLTDSQKRSFIARYYPYRNLGIEADKSMDNRYGISFNHQFFFNLDKKPAKSAAGGSEAGPDRKAPKITDIRLETVDGQSLCFPPSTLLEKMKLRIGKRFDYYTFTGDLERMKKLYQKHHYLGADIRPQRNEANGAVELVLKILPGHAVSISYKGAEIPKKLEKQIRLGLAEGRLGGPALLNATQRLRYHLYTKGHYQAEVSYELTNEKIAGRQYQKKPSKNTNSPKNKNAQNTVPEAHAGGGNEKDLIFHINKGPRFGKPEVRFRGNASIPSEKLTGLFNKKHMVYMLFADRAQVLKSLKTIYFLKGFINARVSVLSEKLDGPSGSVLVDFSVIEGPQYRVGALNASGNRFFSKKKLLNLIGIKEGEIFSPVRYKEVEPLLQRAYHARGFSSSKVQCRVAHGKPGLLDITIAIDENQQAVVEELVVLGNTRTKKSVILRELAFKKGDVIFARLRNKSRRNLYELGLFSQVDIVSIPLSDNESNVKCHAGSFAGHSLKTGHSRPAATAPGSVPSSFSRKYRVEIRVKENKRFRFKYGFRLNSTLESKAPLSYMFTGQFSDFNLFGRGYYLDMIGGIGDRER